MHSKIVSSLAVVGSLLLGGCLGEGDASYQIDTLALTSNFTDKVLLPEYREFSADAQTLVSAVDDYCASIGSADEASKSQAAKAQWIASMAQWQTLEAYLVGPVAANSNNIRNRINLFADKISINTCQLDRTTLAVSEDSSSVDISVLGNNQRGFGGLQYLLFGSDALYSCSGEAPEAWTALSSSQRATARCQQAEKIAEHVAGLANDLVDDWDIEKRNYRSKFINPGKVGTQLQALSDGLFYMEFQVKDAKLRVPLGIRSDSGTNCGVNACPEAVEYGVSETSLLAIKSNLEGFKAAFTGNGGYSFDDVMIDQGFADVAALYVTLVDDAIAVIDASPESLKTDAQTLEGMPNGTCANISANPDSNNALKACLLYGKVKRITDELKTSFVAIVDLNIPDRAQSDND